jgi:hypothetical protein
MRTAKPQLPAEQAQEAIDEAAAYPEQTAFSAHGTGVPV